MAKQHSAVSFDASGGDVVWDDEDITATVAGIAASAVVLTTGFSTDGNGGAHACKLTLATPPHNGKLKIFYYKYAGNVGDTCELTITDFYNGTKVTFSAINQVLIMISHGGKWCSLYTTGTIA